MRDCRGTHRLVVRPCPHLDFLFHFDVKQRAPHTKAHDETWGNATSFKKEIVNPRPRNFHLHGAHLKTVSSTFTDTPSAVRLILHLPYFKVPLTWLTFPKIAFPRSVRVSCFCAPTVIRRNNTCRVALTARWGWAHTNQGNRTKQKVEWSFSVDQQSCWSAERKL